MWMHRLIYAFFVRMQQNQVCSCQYNPGRKQLFSPRCTSIMANVSSCQTKGFDYGKYSKKLKTFFFFCSQITCWLSGLEVTKFLSELQIGKTLIRLLLKKQSDLGLHCLSMMFGRQLLFKILDTIADLRPFAQVI